MVFMKGEINKHSIIPVYHQLQEMFIDQIDEGLYKAGDQLPSENILAAYYKISRNTAQRVLKYLVDRGLAYRLQGKGTFVANKMVTFSIVTSLSYSSEIIGLNKTPRSKLVHAEEIAAPARISRKLEIDERDPVYSIRRIRYVDNIPMSLQTSYIPAQLVPGLIFKNFEEKSLFQTIGNDYGLEIGKASETMQAVQPSKYESKLLEMGDKDAVFLIERITRLKNNSVIEFVKTILRGDKSKFYVELSNKPC